MSAARIKEPEREALPRSTVLAWGGAAFVALSAFKVLIASHLDLHIDEAFAWQESEHLALGYALHPYLWALYTRLGTELLGDTTLGLRLVPLICGIAFPWGVYFLAQPLVGRRDAVYAAGLALVIPPLGLLGAVAYEAPFLLFAVGMLGCFERALRLDRTTWWAAAGILAGLGMATSYRFVVPVLALVLFLVLTAAGRAAWRRPGVYVAAAVVLVMSAPTLIHVLDSDFVSLRFQFMERHGWEFHAKGLFYPLLQAAVMTPLIYGLLIWALVTALGGARRGDAQLALVAVTALTPLAFYYLAVLFADAQRTNIHWALPGYVPLVVLVPALLRRLWEQGFAGRRRR